MKGPRWNDDMVKDSDCSKQASLLHKHVSMKYVIILIYTDNNFYVYMLSIMWTLH